MKRAKLVFLYIDVKRWFFERFSRIQDYDNSCITKYRNAGG